MHILAQAVPASQSVLRRSSFCSSPLSLTLPCRVARPSARNHRLPRLAVVSWWWWWQTDRKTSSVAEHKSAMARQALEEDEAQVLYVYELNQGDRHSPAVLALSRSPYNVQAPTLANPVDASGKPLLAIGDLVPFSNKLYDGSLSLRLGITAGIATVIRTVPEKNGQRYEANYSFYFGDYGHVTVQGPYLTYEDSELAVVGGSGIFRGVYGYVKLQQIIFPTKLFYTFYLFGVAKLPDILLKPHVAPDVSVTPSPQAVAGAPHASLPNFTD